MPLIYETEHFLVDAHDKPHHSRENGGHLKITPKEKFTHRWEMPPQLAIGLMYMTMIVGEATTTVMRSKGLDVVRINFQDNGNWAYKPDSTKEPQVHIHLYIRTSHEKHPDNDPRFQAFPEALVFPPYESGYYDNFQTLTASDCMDIKTEIERLLQTEKYQKAENNI
jgi:diadenosine tetraphosphate (Ap4A) HIT family hydrolase